MVVFVNMLNRFTDQTRIKPYVFMSAHMFESISAHMIVSVNIVHILLYAQYPISQCKYFSRLCDQILFMQSISVSIRLYL